MIILPGADEFDETLAMTLPPNWQQMAEKLGGDYGFVADSQTGMLRIENSLGIREYVNGGEYDERLLSIDDNDELLLVE